MKLILNKSGIIFVEILFEVCSEGLNLPFPLEEQIEDSDHCPRWKWNWDKAPPAATFFLQNCEQLWIQVWRSWKKQHQLWMWIGWIALWERHLYLNLDSFHCRRRARGVETSWESSKQLSWLELLHKLPGFYWTSC